MVEGLSNLRSRMSGRTVLMMGLTFILVVVMGGYMLLNYGGDGGAEAPAALPDLEDDGSARLRGLPELEVRPPSLTEAVETGGAGLVEREEAEIAREEVERIAERAAESPADEAFVAQLERMVPVAGPAVEVREPAAPTPLDGALPPLGADGGPALPTVPPEPDGEAPAGLPPGVSAERELFAREPNQHFDPSRVRTPSANVQAEFDRLADFRAAYQARIAESLAKGADGGAFSIASFDGGEAPPAGGADPLADLPPADVLWRGLPGDILYGFLDADVNSDHLHQVVATVGDGGPLDGAVLVGQPALLGAKRIIIEFSSMHFGGRELPIDAVAVNPRTLEVAMADSVNSHVLDRYGSIVLASLMRGYAESLRQDVIVHTQAGPVVYSSVGPTSTGDGDGGDGQPVTQIVTRPDPSTEDRLVTAAGEVADVLIPTLRDRLSRPPTVKVFARSGVGIKLLSPLTVPRR